MPYLLLAPRQPWEPYGQACSLQAVHWLPKGLADYNPGSANPSDVWANDNAYHNTPARGRGEKANYASFWSKGIAPAQAVQAAVHFWMTAVPLRFHGAFSNVARSGGNVPAWLVFTFQATGERFFSPFTL